MTDKILDIIFKTEKYILKNKHNTKKYPMPNNHYIIKM